MNNLLEDLKEAMKAKDTVKMNAIKSIRSKVSEYEKMNGKIDEDNFIKLVDKIAKDLNKSISIYQENGREDLAKPEIEELNVVKSYLPERLSLEEIEKEASIIKEEIGATEMKDMGRMMGLLKNKLGSSATPADISKVVKSLLS